MIFAFAAPVLVMATVATIDYAWVLTDRVKMQGIADAAALSGAQQALVDGTSATAQRTQSFAQAQLGALSRWNPSTEVTISQNKSVKVAISGSRPALLKSLFPSQGWSMTVSASAQSEGMVPLCALGTGSSWSWGSSLQGYTSSTAIVDLKGNAQITAPNCLIQSNQNLDVANGATLTSGRAQAVGEAVGNVSPAPQSGAAAIADPFSGLNVTVPTTCTDTSFSLNSGSATMPTGVHCGNILINGSSTVTLEPGTHYFYNATVKLTGSATFTGQGVTMVFDSSSTCTFTGGAGIDLTGATSGPLAGFVLIAARDNTSTFTITTAAARTLEGVVYIPNAVLSVKGNAQVAQASAWTVIIAKALSVTGTADLTLNANYSSSNVPVPTGVGPTATAGGAVRLTN